MNFGDLAKEIENGGKNPFEMKFEDLKLKEEPEYQIGDFERNLQIFRLEQNAQHVVSENLAKTLLNITDKIIDSITANFKKLNETENGTNATAKANEDRMASIELQIVEMRKIMQKGPTWPRRDGSFRSDLRTCFQCEEKGHTARDCHQKGQSQNEEEKPTRGMQKSCELQYRTCFQCGEKGHVARNCRQEVQNVSEMEQLKKDLQKSYEMSERRQKSLDELTKRFDNLEKEKQVQDRKLERLSNENQRLLEQIDTLNSVLNSSKEEKTKFDNLEQEKQMQDRKLKELSNENIELLERIDTLNGVLSSSREEITKFDNLDKEKQVQDRKLEKLSNKNRELLEQIDTLNSDLKSSEEEITHLEQEKQMQDRELEELSNENRELLEQIETLNTDKELQESNKEEITNLKSQIQIVSSSLENETVNLKKRCEALESFFTVVKKRHKELNGAGERCRVPLERSEIEQLELRLLELNPCREEITTQN